MKNTLLCSFVFASLCLGCSQSDPDPKSGEASTKAIKVIDPELQKWVGQYKGILPCAACTSFCERCEGMTVDLYLKENQTFKLVRASNSGHNKPEVHEGQFVFTDNGKLKIQLNGVSERNTVLWQQDSVEVLDTKTGLSYEAYLDFELTRKT
ncbi:copper resistance protein NlpE N-terminal domain-containing protein [Acinetobacter sp. ANC 4204]|uniref:copper resistance protein NlpE N-terminal domain-containing protein n=1 Tax=Acinetobacter sp. ANC 4204 TaxID=1977884 RepID=UPI00148A4EAC|nr:copper resistance protein NlpE N-terminal domain-containing protein [Acinetobacter sp. ANC 4204]